MEAAVGTVAGKIAPKLLDFLETNHRLRGELEHGIEYIKSEFVMISAAIEEDGDHPPWSGNQVHKAWIQMVRNLSHAIEDCIDRFTHHATLHPSVSWIHRRYHQVKTVRVRNKFAAAIRRLRKTSEDASKLRTSYITKNGGGGDGSSILQSAGAFDEEEMEADTPVAAMGMVTPRDELRELIRERGPKEDLKLKVISIVGFGGIGKTLLARHVYDDAINHEPQYEARAWVRAANKGTGDVLKEILRQLGTIISGGSLSKLRASLAKCLGTKRFFIVIDDMRAVFWHDIKDAFPVVPGVSSIVLVTTAIQSVATACSSAHGHAYMMRTLAEEHSKQLFFQEASLEEDSPAAGDHTQLSTSEALTKCDGLPLALVTTAQFLQSRGDPRKWANLCDNLGEHLETEDTLASMNRVLVRSYASLGSQDVKTCLLYLGIYPSGHPIRRGILIRRWLAEGLIKQDHRRSALGVAVDNFDKLLDRSIIRPIDDSSNNSIQVKKCQTHGMMLEFILHKSMCQNFVTLLCDKYTQPRSNIRWLSLQHKTAARAKMNPKDLRLVRSLTIFGKTHSSMLDFSKYKLMRVLDLEECDDQLGDSHLKVICSNLFLLRYLSLGSTARVTMLPKEIKKLQLLETLDVRRTKIEILPAQVMELPCLVHLFGKFKLQHNLGDRRMGKLQTWLSENSKLETLSGFVVDKSQEMPQLMGHMEHLTKVKISCESSVDAFASSNLSHLSKAIKGFIERGTQLNEARSLSLNINDEWSQDLLDFSLEKDYSYYLSSLKLQGNSICTQLPLFVTMLGGLTKLCLSFPGDHKLSGNILDALSRVRGLEFLKLIATQLDKLVIRQGALRSLRCLCVMVEVMAELEIQGGALMRLESLQLLCNDLNGFSSTTIQSLPRLKEVALHDGLGDQTKQDWNDAANNHPRRPKLLYVTKEVVDGLGSEPAVKISPLAATDTMAQEVPVERELAENFENLVTSPIDMISSVTTPPGAISTGESVPVAMSEMKNEPDGEILAPATTNSMMLPANHDASVNAQQEYPVQVVISEMGSELAAKVHLAPATTDNTTLSVNHDAFANVEQEYGPITSMESFKRRWKGWRFERISR